MHHPTDPMRTAAACLTALAVLGTAGCSSGGAVAAPTSPAARSASPADPLLGWIPELPDSCGGTAVTLSPAGDATGWRTPVEAVEKAGLPQDVAPPGTGAWRQGPAGLMVDVYRDGTWVHTRRTPSGRWVAETAERCPGAVPTSPPRSVDDQPANRGDGQVAVRLGGDPLHPAVSVSVDHGPDTVLAPDETFSVTGRDIRAYLGPGRTVLLTPLLGDESIDLDLADGKTGQAWGTAVTLGGVAYWGTDAGAGVTPADIKGVYASDVSGTIRSATGSPAVRARFETSGAPLRVTYFPRDGRLTLEDDQTSTNPVTGVPQWPVVVTSGQKRDVAVGVLPGGAHDVRSADGGAVRTQETGGYVIVAREAKADGFSDTTKIGALRWLDSAGTARTASPLGGTSPDAS